MLDVVGGRFAHIPVAVAEHLREPLRLRRQLDVCRGLKFRSLSLRRQVQEQLARHDPPAKIKEVMAVVAAIARWEKSRFQRDARRRLRR